MTTDRYAPQKIDIQKIQQGLSKKQMSKIQYECDLLRVDPQKLMYIAPHLFNEGITSSNKEYVNEPEPVKEEDYDNNESTWDNSSTDDYSYYLDSED